jgi:CarD family transcriptional regulator
MGKVMFKTGDKVVYPAQGVGIVEKIEEMSIMGMSSRFLTIRILENNAERVCIFIL